MAGILKVDRIQSDSNLSFAVAGSNVAYMNASGIVYGNTTIGASVITTTGIAFPATQVPSSDANTLDDYEEGTWTPIITGSSTNPTVTYTRQFGAYTKIGNMVYCHYDLRWSALSGGSGNAYMTLPFTSKNDGYNGHVVAEKNSGWTFTTNYTYMTVENNVGTAYLILLQNGNAVATAGMGYGINVPTGTAYLIGSFCYCTD